MHADEDGKQVTFSITLPTPVKAEIEEIAARESRSQSSVVRQAVKEWLEDRRTIGAAERATT